MKYQTQHDHVFFVLKEALGPLDTDERTAFTAALLACLKPHLPLELQDVPVDGTSEQLEQLVQAYVASLDEFKAVLRTY